MVPERPADEAPQVDAPQAPRSKRGVQPASLKWQENGELSDHDVFNLVCRLRAVESGEHSNELWRLGHKYPSKDAS